MASLRPILMVKTENIDEPFQTQDIRVWNYYSMKYQYEQEHMMVRRLPSYHHVLLV